MTGLCQFGIDYTRFAFWPHIQHIDGRDFRNTKHLMLMELHTQSRRLRAMTHGLDHPHPDSV